MRLDNKNRYVSKSYTMFLKANDLKTILAKHGIGITGIFHVGAHECEELSNYKVIGVDANDIIWIDALPQKVAEAKARNIPNVYHAVITDKDNDQVTFNIANNGQSSSVLEFGTHSKEHPSVKFVNSIIQTTTTIDTFFEKHGLDPKKYNMWNFDIQGAEYLALKGALKSLVHVNVAYLEVNEKELYKDCGLIDDIETILFAHGFKKEWMHMTRHGWGDALYIK
jgi:FkbM family methyltransferase